MASHKCCWPSKGVKDCTHLCAQRPASSHTFPHLQSKLIEVVVLSNIFRYINNRFLCKVVLQTNLKPTHHLVARWQGQVRRCLKTTHAINLFAAKWLPINCFTLTKDGLQTLNIPCLRAKSGSNCLDLLH